MWYTQHGGILVHHKKELSTATCHNTDNPRKHYTTTFHYMKRPEQANPETGSRVLVARVRRKEETKTDYLIGKEFPYGVIKKFWN